MRSGEWDFGEGEMVSIKAGRWWKKVAIGLCVMGTISAAQAGEAILQQEPAPIVEASRPVDPADMATAAAVADGLTTALALSSGAVEMNPLVATSPVGLVAMTGLKIGLVKYAETLPEEDKRSVMKTTSAIWMGAAVNNLLVIASAATPFAIVAGIAAGYAMWQHLDEQYQEQDAVLARATLVPADASAITADVAMAPAGLVDESVVVPAEPMQTSGN